MNRVLKSKVFLIGGDIIIFFLSFLISLFIRFQTIFGYNLFYENLIKFSFLLIIWLFVFYTLNLYHLNKFHGRLDYFKKQIIAIIILTVISTLFFYWYPHYTQVAPKTILIIFAITFLILWLGFRFLIFHLLLKAPESYLIIGSSYTAHKLFDELADQGPQNKKILIYSDAFLFKLNNEITKIIHPPIANLLEALKKERIDKIILDKNFSQAPEIINLFFSEISNIKSEFYELHDFFEKHHQKITIDNLDKRWFIYNLKPAQSIYLIGKRLFDILTSLIGSAFFIILFPILSGLIKLDSKGPIIYKQKRIGQNKRVFYIYKFRTMTHSNHAIQVCAAKDDKRITKIGNHLRKLHLDELPQFINILKGDLSFVGPRPEQPQIVEQLSSQIHFYNQRHLTKPGLTGWAQINFPYCATLEEHKNKLQFDLYYLKNKSLLFDLKIIIKTINNIFFSK